MYLSKIAILCFMCMLAGTAMGQTAYSTKEKAAQQALVRVFDAVSGRDSIALRSYCTPDVSFYEYGQVWTIDTLIRKAILTNTTRDFKRVNTFDFIETRVDKTQAWLTYRLRSVITGNGRESVVQWLETVVLEWQDKQWKLRHLHSTLVSRN